MGDSHSSHHQPVAKEILDDQVIRIKRGRLNRFGFEPAWNAYYDYYLSNKYLKRPILRLEDVTFHLFMRKNLNEDDPTWRMPSFRMMKRRLGVSQDKIEGMLRRLAKAHLLEKISGKRQGEKGADIANTYLLSDPIQELEEFLTVAAAGEFPQALREEWKDYFATPVPMAGTTPRTDGRYGPVPMAGTHKHTSIEQTSKTNKVVEELIGLEIEKGKAQELVARFAPEQIEEKIELLRWKLELQSQGKIRGRPVEDPAAWLIRAIERDYRPPPGFKPSTQRKQEAVQREREATELVRQETERLLSQQNEWASRQRRYIQRLSALKRAYGTGDKEIELWDGIVGELQTHRNQTSLAALHAMLTGSTLLSIKNGEAFIVLQNQFARDWVEKRLTGNIQKLLTQRLGDREVSIKFIALDQPQESDTGPTEATVNGSRCGLRNE
jgi:hypothetical protein